MLGTVQLPSSSSKDARIDGFAAFDEISFDEDELIYADDFMFLFTDKVHYPELDDQLDGVIGFNRFGFD